MNKIIDRFPFISRMVLAIVFGIIAIIGSQLIYNMVPFLKTYFPFVGEVLLVLVTAFLYRTDGQDLSAIGLNLSFRNIGLLFLGLTIGIAGLGLATFLRTIYTGEQWHISTGISTTSLLKSLYYILPSVTVQELMFRGYPFTKTISVIGVVKANILFALLFMLVHVLDEDVLRNPVRMIMLAITIPVGHLFFATGLLRTKTLLFPIGLHWGNNWAVNHLVGWNNNENVILYLTDQKIYTEWLPFIMLMLIFNGCFLLITALIWKCGRPGVKPVN